MCGSILEIDAGDDELGQSLIPGARDGVKWQTESSRLTGLQTGAGALDDGHTLAQNQLAVGS